MLALFAEEELELPLLVYLSRSDRLHLTETCTSLWKAVERHSRRNVEAIFENHKVDDNFVDHITAQGHLPTERRRPLILPYRYMLCKAMNSYLYQLQQVEHGRAQWVQQAEVDGTRLVTMLVDGLLQVWDLSTKQCVHSIRHDFWNPDHSGTFFLRDNRIILFGGDKHVVSWDMETGKRAFTTWLSDDFQGHSIVGYTNKALLLDDARGVKTIDTDTGKILADAQLPPWPPGYDRNNTGKTWAKSNLFICHDKWLVFAAWWSERNQPESEVGGIFVFSIKDFHLSSHIKVPFEQYDEISECVDDPGIIVAAGSGLVDVYTVKEDGLLELKNTFPIAELDDVGCLVATASHVYVDGLFREDIGQRIDMYDIVTGRLERHIVCPCRSVFALTFWKTGNEVLLGLANGPAVAAYCLVEPEQQSC